MPEIRTENEIKLLGTGGLFAYDGTDPAAGVARLEKELDALKIVREPFRVHRFTDDYYTDTGDTFDAQQILLRFRDEGQTGYVTVKKPSVRNGMGLSRREIETEVYKNEGFDRMTVVRDHAQHYLGRTDIGKVPKLSLATVRAEASIYTDAGRYSFCFDRYTYKDPATGRESESYYEFEIETLDRAIADDPQISRLVAVLEDKYVFREVRDSKYARGRIWLVTCRV
ncbi:MAG: CYTH domain-containing protein [Candidatus Methanomethylophilus sp.]|nr:CYTH domain-containing protein [Methanomethylophilus sp.]